MESRSISVEYKDEEKKKEEKKKEEEKKPGPKLTPKVAVITLQEAMLPKPGKINMDVLEQYKKFARPMESQITMDKIDVDKMMREHLGQIDLNAEAFDDEKGMQDFLAVVGVGKGMSTKDILAMDEYKATLDARALPANVGLFGSGGFAGTGKGGGGIDLDAAGGKEYIEAKRETGTQQFKKVTQEKKIGGEAESGPKTEVEITGALADRKLEKWPLPPYPEWAQQQGVSAYLNISLKAGPSGKVEGMVLTISTTGYPDWDNMVIDWIKKHWQWEKVPGLTSPGNIGIRFVLG